MGPAAEHWRRQLEAWRIPQPLLDQVTESPYSWPVSLWKRRDRSVRMTPTMDRILALEPASVLDIGAGVGGSCLPLAERGVAVTALERDEGMADGLRDLAREKGLSISVVNGAWPEDQASVGRFDIVTASHVVHNVPDLGPFLLAMEAHASRAVVIQEFSVHPWAHLGPYYRALHDLERPTGPTDRDLAAVIEEVLGVVPVVESWHQDRPVTYQSWDELLDFYGRRLVLPERRRSELRPLLEADFEETADGLQEKDRRRSKVTVWWRKNPDPKSGDRSGPG